MTPVLSPLFFFYFYSFVFFDRFRHLLTREILWPSLSLPYISKSNVKSSYFPFLSERNLYHSRVSQIKRNICCRPLLLHLTFISFISHFVIFIFPFVFWQCFVFLAVFSLASFVDPFTHNALKRLPIKQAPPLLRVTGIPSF